MQPNWFVGVPVTVPDLQTLLQGLPESCRAFNVHDLHMTVAFLGPMHPNCQQAVQAVMTEVDSPAFDCSFGKGLALPNEERVSALCLDLALGRSEAIEMIQLWRPRLLRAAQAKPDHRLPLPHVTLARPVRKFGQLARSVGKDWVQRMDVPAWKIHCDRLVLYTWSENRQERLFKEVFEHPLPSLTNETKS